MIDAIIVMICWWIAFTARFGFASKYFSGSHISANVDINFYGLFGLGLVFIWFVCLQIFGAYKSWRTSNVFPEIISIFKAGGLAFLISATVIHYFARDEVSRAVVGLFAIFATSGILFSRLVLRLSLKSMRKKGYNLRQIVFVGDEKIIHQVLKRLQGRPELGFQILGHIPVGKACSNLPHLGSLDNLAHILENLEVDQILVCLKNQDAGVLDNLLSLANLSHVNVRIIPDVIDYAVLGLEVEDFDGIPIITVNQSPLVGWNSVLKRFSDIIYACFALLLFSPVFLILSLIIKLTSKGPIFYKQERMGLDGQSFHMFKFRSMRIDAEQTTGAVWAKKDDDRVTAVGRLMRKTSLDEIPQFYNVLKGDMSCVGPRPERPVFVKQFKTEIPGYMLRHRVKTGMTGWAQIHGLRGNTSLEARIEYDLYYITHWSLAMDLKIMFMTVFKGFISPHAY